MLRELFRDAVELARASGGEVSAGSLFRAVTHDSYAVLSMTRVREAARRFHVIGVNRALRITMTAVYGIEIGKDVTVGHGVFFAHPLGIVIGSGARIGNRVRFMGSNTVGAAKDNGAPTIEDDVTIGCGARVLGPIRIGKGAVIGANAVVLQDVPPGAVATGVPATIRFPSNGERRERAGTDV